MSGVRHPNHQKMIGGNARRPSGEIAAMADREYATGFKKMYVSLATPKLQKKSRDW
jgi:hypothetical protein